MRSFLLLFILVLFTPNGHETVDTKVYVCLGKGSKRYHYDKYCRGLSRCSTKIYGITLSKAKKMGRTLCGWED